MGGLDRPGDFDSIDPGVGYYAMAKWLGGRLAWVGVCDIKYPPMHRDRPLVIERQQVYSAGRARKSDIVDLAIAAGGLVAHYGTVQWFLPAQWKGQVPKKVHQRTIMTTGIGRPLDQAEKDLILAHSKHHQKDIIDAVGLGLYYMSVKGINVQH